MGDNTRPLAFWGFISSNFFSEEATPDFYLSMAAFFEPFIMEKDGQLLDVGALQEYAASKLMLSLSEDITEILSSQMSDIGWLVEVARRDNRPLYKCKFTGTRINNDDYNQYEVRLTQSIDGFCGYMRDNSVEIKNDDAVYIEESFTSFLIKQFLSSGPDLSTSVINDDGQIEYWIAKYISYINIKDSASFEFVQKVSGVLLLADVIIEMGSPSQDTKQLSELIVFMDGPLVMNYLGLAGNREKYNIALVVDRLKGAGAKRVCFKHSCDEIRDNLSVLFARPPQERTGPSAEAVRKGDIPENLVANVRNNVEHFVNKVGKLAIVHAQLSQYEYAARYCDDAFYHCLMLGMPAQSPTARERDAASIAIIMRRRGGHETSELRDAKFVLVTSNEKLVRSASEILRDHKALGADKRVIGPAIHQRTIAGLVFANFGLAEKKEISRRQLLAACARVVMLRPKVLERLRQQIGLLNRPEDAAIVDALISQPRASEIIMDRSVGRGRPISASNVEETIAAIKETAADVLRRQYVTDIAIARTQAAQEAEERSRGEVERLVKEKDDLQGQFMNEKTESGSTALRIAELEEQLAIAIQKLAELEEGSSPFTNEGDVAIDKQGGQSDRNPQEVFDSIAMAGDLYRLRFITRKARRLLYPIANGRGGRQAILDVERMLTEYETETSAICLKWRAALRHSETPISPDATVVLDEILDRLQGPNAILDVIRNFSQDDLQRPQTKSKQLLSQIDNFDLVVAKAGADMAKNEDGHKDREKDTGTAKLGLGGPLSILTQAIEAVPAVKYALGIAGIAAAVAIVTTLANGYSRVTLLSLALAIVGMFVLFLFSLLVCGE